MFDWVETSAGRINPRTGKLISPTGGPSRGTAREADRRQERLPWVPRPREEAPEPALMSGHESTSGIGPTLADPLLWFSVGLGIFLVLEASGKTKLLGVTRDLV